MPVPRNKITEDARLKPSHIKLILLEPEVLSSALPAASLILASGLMFYALVAALLQRKILPRISSTMYAGLSERHRITFTCHLIAAPSFIIIAACGLYPVFSFLAGSGLLSTHVGGGRLTIGDVLFVLAQLYSGYYLFELVFRGRFISAISLAHHVGLLIVTQYAIYQEAALPKHGRATHYFYLCMVWGAFDVCSEVVIHVLMIVWRLRRESPKTCRNIAAFCAGWTVLLALAEVAVTIWLFNKSWDIWDIVWKWITPIVFTLWIITQFYGACIYITMFKAERKALSRRPPRRDQPDHPNPANSPQPDSSTYNKR
ncbi:hypothetical protein PG995_014531 [Apiospora arundinis]|uniref:TLC domain-containing protein n=1 Tax=Apiospora arundinis TaxID=335852 RepID=A0ABR2IIG8_9PEZI